MLITESNYLTSADVESEAVAAAGEVRLSLSEKHANISSDNVVPT